MKLIKQIMETPLFVDPLLTREQLKRLAKRHPHTDLFVVVNKRKEFLGTIHENDLFLMFLPDELYEDMGIQLGLELERKFFAKKAKDVMNEHDISCGESDKLIDVAILMAREEVEAIPVLRKNKVVGVINRGTLVRHF